MKTSKFNKSEIFKTAWIFVKNTSLTFSEALKESWRLAKITIEDVRKDISFNSSKDLFNALMSGFTQMYDYKVRNHTEWHFNTEVALKLVVEKSNGFQSDIATKALKYGRVSEKQAWCVAYEYMKLK